MKTYFSLPVLVFLLFYAGTAKVGLSQEKSVENVGFYAVDSNIVVIHYDLFGDGGNKRYKVNLQLKRHTNPAFSYKPKAIFGDVGVGRYEGKDNMIVWSMDHELSKHFSPNPFLDDYYFTIQARRKTRMGWFVLSAALGGAAYYFLVVNPDMLNQ